MDDYSVITRLLRRPHLSSTIMSSSLILRLLFVGVSVFSVQSAPELNPQSELKVRMEQMEAWMKVVWTQSHEIMEENHKLKDTVSRLQDEMLKLHNRLSEQDERISHLTRVQHPGNMLQMHKKEEAHSANIPIPKKSSSQHKNVIKRSDDGYGVLAPVVAQMGQKLDDVTTEIQALKNADMALKNSMTGTTYVRWGQAACPNSSQIVYSGTVGGSLYSDEGAAVDYLCLPTNPTFDQQPPDVSATEGRAGLYGSEYQVHPNSENDMEPTCAVCRTARTALIMVPATDVCQPGWHLEYSGYLMAGHRSHPAASEYVCVDKDHGYILGTKANENGKLLYYTTARCGSLSCPPYVESKFIQCAVCSK